MVGTLDNRLKAMGIVLIVCILMMAPGMAQRARVPGVEQGTGSRVLFLEHYMLANGTVSEGQSPYKSINFPTYWFNENTKQLNGRVDFPVNSSLVMVFGDVLTLKGNFGGGTGNKLFGVYSLPVTADQAVVYSIDLAGNVAMRVNDKTVILKPGESYSYTENETLKEKSAVIDVRYEHTYVNHGFIDKSHIGAGSVTS